VAEAEAGEEAAAAETALAHLRLEPAGTSFADQVGMPGLRETLFLEDAPEGECGVRMHTHMTRGHAFIFPTRAPGSSSR
jgi:hypothetical protein